MRLPLRIAEHPARVGAQENPYRPLMDRALARRFRLSHVVFQPTPAWAHANAAQLTLVHIHWPEGLWRVGDEQANVSAVDRLVETLRVCRELGARIVWTVHNHAHHDGTTPADELGYHVLASHSDLVICHSNWSADWMRATHGTAVKVLVMPIGNFGDAHPSGRDQATVATEVGLDPARPIVVCAGQLRPYKGLDTAIAACRSAGGAWQLLVVGRPGPYFDLDALQNDIAPDIDIALVADHVTDSRFGELIAVSQAVLVPYSNITGSSIPPAAWANGRPIVASRLPYFQEIIGEHRYLGALFDQGASDQLAAAVAEVLAWPPPRVAEATAAACVRLDWAVVTTPLRWRLVWWTLTKPALRQGRRATRVVKRLARRMIRVSTPTAADAD